MTATQTPTPTAATPASGPASAPPTRASRPVWAALALLRGYQAAASGHVSPCRFYPSCSNYAAEAFSVHGFWRGLALTARRLLRCRPFGPHGVDLVPLPAHHRHRGDPGKEARPC